MVSRKFDITKRSIEDDVKGSAGNVRNAASRCVDTGSYFILLGKYTFVRSKHGKESSDFQHQDNGTVA